MQKLLAKILNELADDHFVEVNKMVAIGSEGVRDITDIVLSCYVCYLIAQNGDPLGSASNPLYKGLI